MQASECAQSREECFREITDSYKELVAKVCYLYSGPGAAFDDLFQEVLINLWTGMDSFRGEAKMSTWIYRTAINTCLTWHRRNGRHSRSTVPLEEMFAEPADDGSLAVKLEELRILQGLISKLLPLEKAMITLWLDERSYDEIAAITGLSRANVAVKLHRVKDKLAKMAKEL